MRDKKTEEKEEKKVKAFVTGAAGFLGSHLVDSLKKKGFSITALVMKNEDQSFLKRLGVNLVVGDITSPEIIKRMIPKGAVIFHCAALTPGIKANKQQYFKINTKGTIDLYYIALQREARLFVYISSNHANILGSKNKPTNKNNDSKAYPYSDYGASKKKAELLLKEASVKYPLPALIIRPSGIYGPRMGRHSGFGELFTKAMNKYTPVISKKGSKYQFTFVNNVVNGLIHIYEKMENNFTNGGYYSYNIADSPIHDFETIIRKIKAELNPDSKIIRINYPMARMAGYLGSVLNAICGKEMAISSKKIDNVVGNEFDNCDDLNQLGYRPTFSVDEGIKITAQWLRRKK